MSVGLSGNLGDFGIADVFQLIGQQRKTGVLELTDSNARVQLRFDQGAVVSAAPAGGRSGDGDPLGEMMLRCGVLTREQVSQASSACRNSAQTFAGFVADRGWVDAEEVRRIEDLLTRDTIFEVLRWESGSFDFRAQAIEHEREASSLLGAEQILMDGLRMIDEWQSFAHHVPSHDVVFQRVGRFESYRERQDKPSPEALERAHRLFSLLDGRLSARRVIDLSRLGTFDGTRVLAELAAAGLIKPLHPEGVRTLRRHQRAAESRRGGRLLGGLLGTVAAAGSVVLLSAVAWWAQGAAVAPTGPVEARALERLRQAYATRRVRNALDTYRLAEGEWPGSISVLPARGYLDRDALATPEGRPYYSFSRDDGAVLLAPEQTAEP